MIDPDAPPAEAVPQEPVALDPATLDFGPFNRAMPEELSKALLELARDQETIYAQQRMNQLRRAMRNRYLWRSIHYFWWSPKNRRYMIFGQDPLPDGYETPRSETPINLYRGYGLAFMAVVSEGKVNVRFWPQDPEQQEDVETAEAASDVMDMIERNNNPDELTLEECRLLWLDGFIAYNVRYVVDGDRFGYDEVEELAMGMGEISPAQHVCASCSTVIPAEAAPDGICPTCGYPLGPETFQPPVTAPVPVLAGVREVPRGQEVIEPISVLETIIPLHSKKQRELGFLTHAREIHRAKLMAVFADKAKDIEKASPGGASSSGRSSHGRGPFAADEGFERDCRLRIYSGGETLIENDDLLTFRETWLRPWVFESLPSETPDQQRVKASLKALFPSGCRVAYFDDTYLESNEESMDDYWVLLRGMPSDTLDGDGVGEDAVAIQKRHTTIDNIQLDTYERGIPATFVDSQAMSVENWTKQPTVPGAVYKIRTRPGLPAGAQFHETQPAKVSPQAIGYQSDLAFPYMQHVTGLYPAVYGGDTGANDTASGIAIQRNQAKGRIGIFYRMLKVARAMVGILAVNCFRKNRSGDVANAIYDPASAQFKSKLIRLDALKGGVYARPETDENFPSSWAEKQAMILGLLERPEFALMMQSPANAAAIQRLLSLGEFKMPGTQARTKQLREIEVMLANAEMGGGPMMVLKPDPEGKGEAVPELMPTIMPDLLLDNHPVSIQTCQEWDESDAGQLAKLQNPNGWLDVKLHAEWHGRMWQQLQVLMAQPQAQIAGETAAATAGPEEKGAAA